MHSAKYILQINLRRLILLMIYSVYTFRSRKHTACLSERVAEERVRTGVEPLPELGSIGHVPVAFGCHDFVPRATLIVDEVNS